jgi:hypothetical protein
MDNRRKYTVRKNKYRGNPFRPQPQLRTDPKSRRQHKMPDWCIRESRCKNAGRCDECVGFSLWEEKQSGQH